MEIWVTPSVCSLLTSQSMALPGMPSLPRAKRRDIQPFCVNELALYWDVVHFNVRSQKHYIDELKSMTTEAPAEKTHVCQESLIIRETALCIEFQLKVI
ncbi:hypothetical protein H6P81_005263 [Aristolochia fimbriata]|uniref:Uncharacterized protein n=1 Tax=Aristolochia fimbriata TaxID=158543 RepID=A0AAV7EV44_ARIFI|nr:hypothetical protein H6P81_005263 [Aristolochia fimbriata]